MFLGTLRPRVRRQESVAADVEEAMKWSFPHFMYKGMLCSMASFKQHAAFGFWKGSLVLGDESKNAEATGQLGRLTTLADLPPAKVLAGYLKRAVALNDDGVKVVRAARRDATETQRTRRKNCLCVPVSSVASPVAGPTLTTRPQICVQAQPMPAAGRTPTG
jgi:hypothetical protein